MVINMVMDRRVKVYAGTEIISDEEREVGWIEVRALRDNQLSRSDLYLSADYPITDEQRDEMREYRIALRDLPSNHDTANEAADAFPVQPEWMVD